MYSYPVTVAVIPGARLNWFQMKMADVGVMEVRDNIEG